MTTGENGDYEALLFALLSLRFSPCPSYLHHECIPNALENCSQVWPSEGGHKAKWPEAWPGCTEQSRPGRSSHLGKKGAPIFRPR